MHLQANTPKKLKQGVYQMHEDPAVRSPAASQKKNGSPKRQTTAGCHKKVILPSRAHRLIPSALHKPFYPCAVHHHRTDEKVHQIAPVPFAASPATVTIRPEFPSHRYTDQRKPTATVIVCFRKANTGTTQVKEEHILSLRSINHDLSQTELKPPKKGQREVGRVQPKEGTQRGSSVR